MNPIEELLRGPVAQAVKEQLAEEIRNVKCYEAQEVAHLLSLLVEKFSSLAKAIPTIEFGAGREKWCSQLTLGSW